MTTFEVNFDTNFHSPPAEMIEDDRDIDEMVNLLASDEGFLADDMKTHDSPEGSVGSLIDFDEIFEDEEPDNPSSLNNNDVILMDSIGTHQVLGMTSKVSGVDSVPFNKSELASAQNHQMVNNAHAITPSGATQFNYTNWSHQQQSGNQFGSSQTNPPAHAPAPAPVMNNMYQSQAHATAPAPVMSNIYPSQSNSPPPAPVMNDMYPSQQGAHGSAIPQNNLYSAPQSSSAPAPAPASFMNNVYPSHSNSPPPGPAMNNIYSSHANPPPAPVPVMSNVYPSQENSSVPAPAPVPSNMYPSQQNPPASAPTVNNMYPSQENSGAAAQNQVDPNTFAQRFESAKSKLWNSMQKSQMSRAHIDNMMAHKQATRRHSATSEGLENSRKQLQASFAGDVSHHQQFNMQEGGRMNGSRRRNRRHSMFAAQNMNSGMLSQPFENNTDSENLMEGPPSKSSSRRMSWHGQMAHGQASHMKHSVSQPYFPTTPGEIANFDWTKGAQWSPDFPGPYTSATRSFPYPLHRKH